MAEMTALEFLKCKDRICRTCACNVCPIWRSRPIRRMRYLFAQVSRKSNLHRRKMVERTSEKNDFAGFLGEVSES